MRVLVTGATGFVGRATVRQLSSAGVEVVALVHLRPPEFDTHVAFQNGDILDVGTLREAVHDVDAIIHLAALANTWESFDDPVRYFRTNVQGTVNLVDSVLSFKPRSGQCAKRIVFASTGLVYGLGHLDQIIEDSRTDPSSPYAASKIAAEHVVKSIANAGHFGAVILRACNIVGTKDDSPGQERRILPQIISAARHGRGIEIFGGDNVAREFLHVDDFASAIVLALDACEPSHCQTYNVGTGTAVTIAELTRLARAVTGRQIPILNRRASQDSGGFLLDSTLIRRQLGWRPKRSDIRTIIQEAWHAELHQE